MKIFFFTFSILSAVIHPALAQQNNYDHSLLLEATTDTTANVSFGDFNGDGHLDMLLVKGRHWPIIDKVLLGDGKGNIQKAYNLGSIADRSYTGGLADFNGDGFTDIAVSNDAPDKKLIYFNDGKGNFKIGSEFGLPEWPTRNLSIADINADGLPDIILANRGDIGKTSNYICFNKGKGQFTADCMAFAPYPATTIFPADINKDGFVDLVVPYRDSGQSYVYMGSSDFTFPETRRVPFGPPDATIRMAAVADFNGDNLPDIVMIDEFKGVYLYTGQKDQTFSAGISLADKTIVPYALAIADLNNDKKPDIIVGHVEAPSTIFFNDGTGSKFTSVSFGDAKGTVYAFAVGDFNEDGIPDIAAARSDATNVLYFGNSKLKNRKMK
ncbi:MAG: VCBS repeat-containing protein [Agriterribacter sp.]